MFIEIFKQNRVGLNFIRYMLALIVIYDHSFHMGGFGEEPVIYSLGERSAFGQIAVGGFFVLSGYLITISAQNNSFADFLISRFLRIWPGLLALLLFTVVIIGPLFTILENRDIYSYFQNFRINGPYSYFLHNLSLPVILQDNLDNIFDNVPNFLKVNGSLWTLPLEIRAYLICYVLVSVGKKFNLFWTILIFEILLTFYIVMKSFNITTFDYFVPNFIWINAWSYWFFIFFFGSLVAIFFQTRTYRNVYSIFAIALFVIVLLSGGVIFKTVGACLFIFIFPILSQYCKLNKLRFFVNDISYGTYIYGYVIGQTLIYIFPETFPNVYIFFFTTALITTIFALISWFYVEKPALGFRQTFKSLNT